MTDRLLPFQAIENFRDFGGYQGSEGTVVRGRLFRSGQLSRATEQDRAEMAGLGFDTIVDLRARSEREAQPDRHPEGWHGQVIESDLGGDGEAPHIVFLKTQPLTKASAHSFMHKLYAGLPFDPAMQALFKQHFTALAKGANGVLVHCAAGKDRTGLLVALTQKLLGVGADDVMADYLATNAAVRLEERAEAIGKKLSKMTNQVAERDAVVAFLGVSPDFIQQAWSAIDDRYGDVATYLRQELGITDAEQQSIRQHLTV